LLIVLHGGGGTAEGMIRFTGFNQIADANGFIVVYPDGLDKSWNDGRVYRRAPLVTDDVAYISALIDHLQAGQNIDPTRIFATGISNGGFMSYRLACELSDKITGIAPVTANLSVDLEASCAPSQPVKMLIINGTDDPLVPYDGGEVALPGGIGRGKIRSTAATLDFWAAHNGCGGDRVIVDEPNRALFDRTRLQSTTLVGCDAPVKLFTVINGGHTWPGGSQYLPVGLVGRTSRDMDASQIIWEFFATP
jgi:polyhydroxybutyrate depolymerase